MTDIDSDAHRLFPSILTNDMLLDAIYSLRSIISVGIHYKVIVRSIIGVGNLVQSTYYG